MVSIIIPAYNAQAYLRECLGSVLAQSFPDWEAIVVDDGSTDSTLDIAREYAGTDCRFKVFTKPNGGLSDARNYGLEHIAGEWVTFLDSDDMLYPHSLMTLMENADSGCDVVAGMYERNAKYVNRKRIHGVCNSHCMSGMQAAISGLYQEFNTSVCGKLFKYKSIERIRFSKGVWYEDLDYMARLLPSLDKVSVIREIVYFYRDNPNSFINKFHPRRLDVLKVTRCIEELAVAKYPCMLSAARDRRLSANFNIYGLLSVYDKGNSYGNVKEECWHLIEAYRFESLVNPMVRMKNKIGILVSYMGRKVMSCLSQVVY